MKIKTETLEEFLKRGGQIKKPKPGEIEEHKQKRFKEYIGTELPTAKRQFKWVKK